MSNIKSEFYKTLNNIVADDRLSNEEIYIINDYLGRLEATIKELEQENKQLKEEIENIKDFNNKLQASKDRLDKDDYNLAHILTELEKWFKKEKQIAEQNITESKKWLEIEEQKLVAKSDIHTGKIIRRYMQYGLNKIQELKEKYK